MAPKWEQYSENCVYLEYLVFDVFPHHFLMKYFLLITLGYVLFSFFLRGICSKIVLKLADLCKCTRRPKGSMNCEVSSTLHSYQIFMFYNSHVNFRFVLGSILGSILVSLCSRLEAFGGTFIANMS